MAAGDGLEILTGESIKWKYTVTNVGNVDLSNVDVTDSVMGVDPAYVSGDADTDGVLDLTETWLYTATGKALESGTYTNLGTATGDYTDDAGHIRYYNDNMNSVIANFKTAQEYIYNWLMVWNRILKDYE